MTPVIVAAPRQAYVALHAAEQLRAKGHRFHVEPQTIAAMGAEAKVWIVLDLGPTPSSAKRAAAALEMLPLYEAEARERMLATLAQSDTAKETFPDRGQARDQVGDLLGVSGRTVDRVRQVREATHV